MGDNMLRIMCFLIILATVLSEGDTSNKPCTTSTYNGTCVPITECPTALLLLKQGDVKALNNIFCGFKKASPKVCCTLSESAIVFNKNTEETATNRPGKVTTAKQVN